ncbi:MAG TPA: DUF5678 domain-containing protein [Planctomycetota bacterium]|nr:DUF5678 domain-containing protein [Planctomycetota bacterium]
MPDEIEREDQWLADHSEELTRYPGEFIAVADGQIVAHGKIFADVLTEARNLGYEPLMARGFSPDVLEVP